MYTDKQPANALALQRSLRRRNARLTRIDSYRLPERPRRCLENALGNVMAVAAVMQHKMQVQQRIRRDGLPKLADELRIKIADLLSRKFDPVDKPDSPAEVERGCDQRLFHRQGDVSVTCDAALITQRLGQCLTEANANILDRMMLIDFQISLRVDAQIDQRMFRQQGEHMIKKTNARANGRRTNAIQIQF